MIVCSHQPVFLPWVGYWNKLASSDWLVQSCAVTYAKDGFINRSELAGSWLTVPLHKPNDQPIDTIMVGNDTRRLRKNVRAVELIRGPYASRLETVIAMLNAIDPGVPIFRVNSNLMVAIARGIGLEITVTDDRQVDEGGTKTERLAKRLLRNVPEMTEYRAGAGALSYLDPADMPCPVLIQKVSMRHTKGSILQLIADEPDPLDAIMSAATWVPLEEMKRD